MFFFFIFSDLNLFTLWKVFFCCRIAGTGHFPAMPNSVAQWPLCAFFIIFLVCLCRRIADPAHVVFTASDLQSDYIRVSVNAEIFLWMNRFTLKCLILLFSAALSCFFSEVKGQFWSWHASDGGESSLTLKVWIIHKYVLKFLLQIGIFLWLWFVYDVQRFAPLTVSCHKLSWHVFTDHLPDQPRSALKSEPNLQRSRLERSSYRYWT